MLVMSGWRLRATLQVNIITLHYKLGSIWEMPIEVPANTFQPEMRALLIFKHELTDQFDNNPRQAA